jgi:hypothetical protein
LAAPLRVLRSAVGAADDQVLVVVPRRLARLLVVLTRSRRGVDRPTR